MINSFYLDKPCFSSPCLNNGVCVDENTSYRCECRPGYSGNNCQNCNLFMKMYLN